MLEVSHETYRFGRFCLDPSRHALYLQDVEVPLTAKSFDVLLYLARNPGRVVTKDELLDAVWSGSNIEEGNLAQQIFRLRKAFEIDPASANLIHTVSGRGYQFTADVTREVFPIIATELASNLEHYRERTGIVVEEFVQAPPPTHPAPHPALPGRISAPATTRTLALAAVAFIAVAAIVNWKKAHATLPGHHEIVIASFENRTGDTVFDYVLNNALSIDLQQSPELTVLPVTRVKTTLKQMERSPDTLVTRAVALEVCERNSAKAVLAGSITRLDRRYVVFLDATDCRSGTIFAALQSQAANKDAVLKALDDVDTRMRARLGESLKSIQGFDVPIQKATTASFDALVEYSRGVRLSDSDAIHYYRRAIQLDPNFALGWHKLGVSYENLGDVPAAKQAYTRAYELRGPTSVYEQYLISTHYVDFVQEDMNAGIRGIHTWLESYPDSDGAWAMLANDENLLGLYTQAIEAGNHGRTPHPTWYFYFVTASAYLRASQFDTAEALCREGLTAFPGNDILHRIMEEIVFDTHNQAEYTRQITSSHGTATEYQTLAQEAREDAAGGNLKLAESSYDASRKATEAQKISNYVAVVNADQALDEAVLGSPRAAIERATLVPPDLGEPSFVAAYAASLAGDHTYPQKVIDQITHNAPPSSTLAQNVQLPILRASLELRKGHPERVPSLLEPAQIYQLRDFDYLWLLASAYLQSHHPADAVAQFQKILDNPGVDGKSPMLPLAHLGLARAFEMQGKPADSRAQYEQLFALWRTADPDLPILKQAHTEYSRLL